MSNTVFDNFSDYYIRNRECIHLPLEINKSCDYFKKLVKRFDDYTALISSTDELNTHFPFIKEICDLAIKALTKYYSGDFIATHSAIQTIIEKYRATVSGIMGNIGDYFIDNESKMWFRARVSNRPLYSKEDMKSIPFSERKKIMNQRYSINGIPCVYLANSIVGCWEELNRPHLEDFWVSYIEVKQCKLLNLSNTATELRRSLDYCEDKIKQKELIDEFFCLWPLQCVCSAIIKEEGRAFKEEYVFPQLLMQCLKGFGIDGVMYFSSKIPMAFDGGASWISKCIAIPVYQDPNMQDINTLCNFYTPHNIGLYTQGIINPDYAKIPQEPNWARTHAVLNNLDNKDYYETNFYRCEIELSCEPK